MALSRIAWLGHRTARLKAQQWSVTIMSTLAFTVCFAVWMMFGVIGTDQGHARAKHPFGIYRRAVLTAR